MTSDFSFVWKREGLAEIVEVDRLDDRFLSDLSPFWSSIDSSLALPTTEAVVLVDGVVRGWAGASVAPISSPQFGFEPIDPPLAPGDSPWVIGGGARVADWIGDSARSLLIENMRVLLGYELCCEGILVAVPYVGWDRERPGGERHYLQMVEYGSRRDQLLDLYLELGFWFAGRHPNDRIAYMARRLA